MKGIGDYSDYRNYLKDYYDHRKSKSPGYSYRVFCRKAGMNSPSFYKSVVEGKRSLTEKTIQIFICGLGLNALDGEYFRTLVHFNQAKNLVDKQKWLESMRIIRMKVKQRLVPYDEFAYYSKWYYPVIREQACIYNWDGKYHKLAQSLNPPIKTAEAREAVEILLELGFLKKDKNDNYIQKDPAISTGPEVKSLAVRSLNTQMAKLGEQSIERIPSAERDVSSMVIGISDKTFHRLKEEIQVFKKRVVNIVHGDKESNKIYNLNLHLFPLSDAK